MFLCKDLLTLNSMKDAKLIAGDTGLEKGIRWSYKAENLNFEKWVRGQELLIISGPVIQRRNFDLYQTIEKAIELHMSCALILIGENYVENIEERVVKLANQYSFPLFTLPWNVPLIDVFEELGHAIAYLDEKKDMTDSLLAEILFGNGSDQESMENKCQEIGKDVSILEQVMVAHFANVSTEEMKALATYLQNLFDESDYPALVSRYGDRIIVFLRDSSENIELIHRIMEDFRYYAENENVIYTVCISEACKNVAELQKSFQETSKMNSILEHLGRTNETVFFHEMGYYRLLLSQEDTLPMQKYVRNVLGAVFDYDSKNHTELIETLWMYFCSDCNMKLTAEKIFSHKNTIKYRLQRIEELTGRRIDNRMDAQEIFHALIIYELGICGD